MMGGWNDGWSVAMWAWMGAWLLVLIFAVLWLVRRASLPPRGDSSAAADVLDHRLAVGDITVEQYRSLKRTLGDSPRSRGLPGQTILLAASALLLASMFIAMPAWAMSRGGWDMWDHMNGMMGGGRDTSGAPVVTGSATQQIAIRDFAFSPGNVEVPLGATVTWTNNDSAPHNATAKDGSWRTKDLSKGQSDSVTFSRSGQFDYICTIHPSMKATISVK